MASNSKVNELSSANKKSINQNIQYWIRKNNKMLAHLFTFLMFVILFCLVILAMTDQQMEYGKSGPPLLIENIPDTRIRESRAENYRNVYEACNWHDKIENCTFECSATTISKINNQMDNFVKNFALSFCFYDGISLELNDIEFEENTLKPGWLNIELKLLKLDINSKDVEILKENSFSGRSLRWIDNLTLKNFRLFELDENTFKGLRVLKHLQLEAMPIEIIEKGILNSVSHSLESLMIYYFGTYEVNLLNLTGCNSLPKLKTLAISYSNVRKIEQFSFSGLRVITAMYLANCQIDSIAKGAFDHIVDTIEVIDLRQNRLVEVDSSFDKLINKPNIQIYVGSFVWGCYLMGPDLQIVIQNNPEVFPNIHCEPSETSLTTIPSTRNTILSRIISCEDNEAIIESEDLLIGDYENIKIDIETFENGTVQIAVEGVDAGWFLLWFYTQDKDTKLSCLYNSLPIFAINDLTEDQTYTFCVMHKYSKTISPFNCRPYYYMPNDNSENAWLTVNDKVTTISAVIVVYLTCTAVGSILGYCLLRMNPMLLKGSEGVVIVKKNPCKRPSTIVLDICSDNNVRRNTSPAPLNSTEYIESEPKYGYERPAIPSRFDIVKSKLEYEASGDRKSKLSELSPDIPAPLPPMVRKSLTDCTTLTLRPIPRVRYSADDGYMSCSENYGYI